MEGCPGPLDQGVLTVGSSRSERGDTRAGAAQDGPNRVVVRSDEAGSAGSPTNNELMHRALRQSEKDSTGRDDPNDGVRWTETSLLGVRTT